MLDVCRARFRFCLVFAELGSGCAWCLQSSVQVVLGVFRARFRLCLIFAELGSGCAWCLQS